ncbi:hypothetical protein I204_00865 [Kwoniella mangroviensis CBS 8886]|nr:hypothetical protein I204_00865 [Kwoniella mangroviensis CBS 8886]
MAPTTAGAVAIYNPNGRAAIIVFLIFGGIAAGLWTSNWAPYWHDALGVTLL